MKALHIVVACGGTGGHVFPGVAVARELRERGHRVEVMVTGRAIERSALQRWDGDVFETGMRQISFRNLSHIIRSFIVTFKKLKNTRPDALLAMGCYSCLSPVAAARLLRVPIILHEANAVPGKAVEFLARYAALTAVSFADTSRWLRGSAVKVTGLPVRADLAECPRFDDIPADAFTVFITGGSQGARRINELASQALCLLARAGAGNLYVIHQTGTADEEAVRTAYAAAGVQARVSAFIDEMGRAYASADLVVCRAGASTCFELCLLNKPALLIPLPGALRDHQRLNALPLARAGGVDMAEQEGLSARSLMRYIKNRMESPVTLQRMSQALCELATPDAARRLADAVVACADGE